MDDAEIARKIQQLGLELEYIRELAAAMGFAADEGWSDAVFAAIEEAEPEQRRRAALRTLALADA